MKLHQLNEEHLIVQTGIDQWKRGGKTTRKNYMITDIPKISLKQFEKLYKVSFKESRPGAEYNFNRYKTDDDTSARLIISSQNSPGALRNASGKIEEITWKEFVKMIEADWPIGYVQHDDDFSE